MVEPFSKISAVSSVVHLYGSAKDSKQHSCLPLTPQVLLVLLNHMVHMVETLHSSLEILKSLLLLQAPHKVNSFLSHLVNGLE